MGGFLADKYTDSALNDEVRNLDEMGLAALRSLWREHWGTPPRLRSPGLLRRIVAWRLQAEAYGGLDASTKARLRSKSIPRNRVLPAGTRLSREYRGTRHEVEIAVEGGWPRASRGMRHSKRSRAWVHRAWFPPTCSSSGS